MDEENEVVTPGEEEGVESDQNEQTTEPEETTIVESDENFGDTLGFDELDFLLNDYLPGKSTYTVDDTAINVIHSITVGDVLIILLLTLLLFTQLLTRLIGRR